MKVQLTQWSCPLGAGATTPEVQIESRGDADEAVNLWAVVKPCIPMK